MSKNNILYRALDTEFTADEAGRRIHGLAIPVNSRSAFIHDEDGEYFEIVEPEAVNEDLILNNDIKVYLDHDPSQGVYARSKYGKGSLELMVTERGLEFEFPVPNTVFGDALIQGVVRGDYDKISYGFQPEVDAWIWTEDGQPLHIVRSFKRVVEISILSLAPAFPATELELRSLEQFKKESEDKYNESIRKIEEAEEQLHELYNDYIDIIY